MNDPLLIYGSYGYTGELIVRRALDLGLRPILAGRSADAVRKQAEAHQLDHRVFGLTNARELDEGLRDIRAVIHCAGPFSRTAEDMAMGCIRNAAHYLDITGEIEVFERMAALDARAAEAGCMLLPGTGFDVVPSDCLAAHLKRNLPGANSLSLAFFHTGRPSHGTATTIVENLGKGGLVRRNGKLTKVPSGWRTRTIDFGERRDTCMTIPWGDVSTAYYSTGIPNIEVFMAAPFGLRLFSKLARPFGALIDSPGVQRFLKSRIPSGGPSEAERRGGYCVLWGEATAPDGTRAEARMRTPDGYTLTALCAVHIARKALSGSAPAGFQTPSLAYGPDLILEIEGVSRN